MYAHEKVRVLRYKTRLLYEKIVHIVLGFRFIVWFVIVLVFQFQRVLYLFLFSIFICGGVQTHDSDTQNNPNAPGYWRHGWV